MLVSGVKSTLFDGHLVSVVLSVSNLVLCLAMKAVSNILLEQEFRQQVGVVRDCRLQDAVTHVEVTVWRWTLDPFF